VETVHCRLNKVGISLDLQDHTTIKAVERIPGSSVHAALKAVSAASSIAPASAAAASPLATPRPAPQWQTSLLGALTMLTGRGCRRAPDATTPAWPWVTDETLARHNYYEAPMLSQCIAPMLPNNTIP